MLVSTGYLSQYINMTILGKCLSRINLNNLLAMAQFHSP
jgi:hypothetical protein